MTLTVREAARLLSTDEDQIHRWIEAGEIPFHRALEELRLNRSELLEWATARRMPLSAEMFHDSQAAHPQLGAMLRRVNVHHRVPGSDRAAVLRAVVARLPLPDPADRDLVEQILLAREHLGCSAVGDGIAIPHVRHPLVFHGDGPVLTICFLERPLDLGAPDGKPVTVLFTLISPTIRTHLQALARIAVALLDPAFKAAIVAQAPAAAILHEAERLDAALAHDSGSGAPEGGSAR